MRSAGFDADHATSETPRLKTDWESNRPVYEVLYEFPDKVMFLYVDAETSETTEISGEPGRGPSPTSDTATLTREWAEAKLLSLNPYKIARGLIRMGAPVISYDEHSAKYEIRVPRLDAAGHAFEEAAAFFDYDHAKSRVTFLSLGVHLPEPSVTTGTMISEEEATSIALQRLLANRTVFFEHVPEKMAIEHVPRSTSVTVVERNKGVTTGTAVAYKIDEFKSRLTDPSYTGPYEKGAWIIYVDVFSGEVVAGHASRSHWGP